jgi:Protein of unknown function (DUF2911)
MRLLFAFPLLAFLSACQPQQKPIGTSVELTPANTGNTTVNPYAPVDISPMDMSYWPVDYPKQRMASAVRSAPMARVIYSRPHLQGRKLFNGILQYEQLWRLGANEATELQLFQEASIEGQRIKAGRYTLYCIPHPESWTFILNGTTDIWGVKQEFSTDLARFEVPVTNTGAGLEYFTMAFKEKKDKAELIVAWENWEARIQFTF